MAVDLTSITLRALGFVALFQAVGLVFFLAFFGERLTRLRPELQRIGLIASSAGVVLIVMHLALDAPRMAGDFSGLWDGELQRLVWSSGSGLSVLVQAGGLLGVAISLARSSRGGARSAAGCGLIAIGGFLLTGHTSAHPLRAVLAPLLALHLLVVAFWFGSLLPLMRVIRIESRSVAVRILEDYSAMAGWLVPLILLAGLAMAWILAGSLGVLRQPYGQLLIVKFLGFMLLMLLAAGQPATGLRRSIAMEIALLVAVLSTTAVLTTYFSPH